ncbi:MAG: hypothetical protein CMJ76_04260 [Planctomycetaceae bacterium]|nr:hypothetical protein [Planctomycetaceae bacterium]
MNANGKFKLRWLLLAVCIFRTAILLILGEQFTANLEQDVDRYLHLAGSLAESSVYELHDKPTAFRPILYPLLIAVGLKLGLTAKIWIMILHVSLAAGTVWLTVALGRHIKDYKTGWFAGILVMVDPILLHQSLWVMTETLATFLAVLTMLRVAKFMDEPKAFNALLTGLSFALAGYCRPTFYLYALFTLTLFLLVLQTSLLKRFMTSFLIGCIILLALSPWIYRNYQLFNKPIPATTHGGYTLLLGNNPLYYQQLDDSTALYSAEQFDAGVLRFNVSTEPGYDFWSAEASLKSPVIKRDEAQLDSFCYAVAFHHINENFVDFARGCVTRIKAFWTPLPTALPKRSDTERYAIGIWYTLIYLLLINFTLFHCRQWFHSGLFAGFCMAFSFTLMHAVFWSNMRMRAPIIPILCLVAAVSFLGPQSESNR